MANQSIIQKPSVSLVENTVYYAPLWIAPKTGNIGFICLDKMFTQIKHHLPGIVDEYKQRLLTMYLLEPAKKPNDFIRLKYPEHKAKYPIVEIDEGGTILPLALVSGPLYDKEMNK